MSGLIYKITTMQEEVEKYEMMRKSFPSIYKGSEKPGATVEENIFEIHKSDAIFIRKIGDYEHTPFKINDNGNWIDLKASQTVTLKKGERTKIPLGIAMKLPDGCEAHLAPRSSTCDKFKIMQTNSVGVIDNSYSGNNDEWKMPVIAVEDTMIYAGDRIAQFRLMPTMEAMFNNTSGAFPMANFSTDRCLYIIFTDDLMSEDRGGFGSTGVN